MEKHPEKSTKTGVTRADGSITPFNAGDAVAAVVDMYGLPIPRSFKARIGKSAKELLEDGFEPNVVCAAMLWAIKLARPHLVENLALEMQSAQHGVLGTFPEYQGYLQRLNRQQDPGMESIRTALKGAFRNDALGS